MRLYHAKSHRMNDAVIRIAVLVSDFLILYFKELPNLGAHDDTMERAISCIQPHWEGTPGEQGKLALASEFGQIS